MSARTYPSPAGTGLAVFFDVRGLTEAIEKKMNDSNQINEFGLSRDQRDYWRRRGFEDGRRGRAPLFRNTRARGVFADADDADVAFESEGHERAAGRAYLSGFHAAEELV